MEFRDWCPECGGQIRFAVENGAAVFVCIGLPGEHDEGPCGWLAEIPRDDWARATSAAVIRKATA